MTELIQLMECPFCEHGTASLHQEQRSFVVKSKTVESKFLFYRCDTCKEQFTTTESDTVSFNEIYGAS